MKTNLEQQQIRETAGKLFREKGLENVSVTDIALQGGVEAPVIEYYFKNEKNLFDRIIREEVRLLFHNLNSILNNEKSTLTEKSYLLIHYYFSFMEENRNLNQDILKKVSAIIEREGEEKIDHMISETIFSDQLKYYFEQFQPDDRTSVTELFMDLTSLCILPGLIAPSYSFREGKNSSAALKERLRKQEKNVLQKFQLLVIR